MKTRYIIISFAALLAILAVGAFFAYKMPESLHYIFPYSIIASYAPVLVFGNCKEKPKNPGARIILAVAVAVVYLFAVIWFLWTHPLSEINNPNIGALIVIFFGALGYVSMLLIS